MQAFLKENLPEAILLVTGNADYNAPIMSINKRMGYKIFQVEKEYNIRIEDLRENL